MSSLFLFGAGASFGSGPCHPEPPPLGTQLFQALRSRGGVAAQVSDALKEVFQKDFEEGMDQFWREHNTRTSALLRDMARFFAPFEPLDGNCYVRLVLALGGTRRKAVFATTNYDLLIERAVVSAGHRIAYAALPVPPGNVPVLKLHGSCNFLPDLASRQFRGVSFELGGASNASILDAPVRVATCTDEILRFCIEEDSIAPALAMYHSSKRVLYCSDFVAAQQAAFVAATRATARIYVIGLRVHVVDTHIWGPLARAIAPIHYVGREPDEFVEWARSVGRRRAYVLADSFEGALPKIATQHGR